MTRNYYLKLKSILTQVIQAQHFSFQWLKQQLTCPSLSVKVDPEYVPNWSIKQVVMRLSINWQC